MKYLYLILFLTITICGYSQTEKPTNYLTQLSISKKRLDSTPDSIFHSQLETEILENIFPFWYSTPWDFNGYTNTPRKGVIACGYFVSTTLKHVGFNLNRYDIAKMYSSDIVKVLCHGDYETLYDYGKFKSKTIELEKGLYILGLSNHVGFLSIEVAGAFFIHSDYASESGVRKELVSDSFALQNSSSFWIGNFSNNKSTLDCYKAGIEYEKLESK